MGDLYANPFTALYLCVHDQHRPLPVLLALAAALLAGTSAMLSFHRAQRHEGLTRALWTAASGLALGAGAWSAHNIAMLGYLPSAPFSFILHITLTALALLLASGVISAFLLQHLPQRAGVLTAGLFFSNGLSVSHYLGMAAIDMPATVRWASEYVAASVIMGILLTLPTFAMLRRQGNRLTAAGTVACFGLLISLTHMTGMVALEIVPGRPLRHAMAISPTSLAFWIGLVTMGLFILGLLVALSNYRTQAALAQSERQLSALARNTSDYAICMLDLEGRISQWNTGAERLTGYPEEEAIGMPIARLFSKADQAEGVPAANMKMAAETGSCHGQWRSTRRDGSEFWVDITVDKVCDSAGRHIGYSSITHDITPIRQAQELAAQTSRQLDMALENMHEGLCLFDAREQLVLCNRRFCELWNLGETVTAPGTPLKDLITAGFMNPHGPDRASEHLWEFRHIIDEALAEERVTPVVVELGSGQVVSIANSPLAEGGWVTTCTDITEQRRSEAQIEHMALHDPLTGLPNRTRYYRRIDHAIETAAQDGTQVAAVAIDLDRFKEINDTYGHEVGDEILRVIGERLASGTGDGEVIARLGGDEFAAAKSFTGMAELDAFIARINEAIGAPIVAAGHKLDVNASLGVALYPRNSSCRETLLNNADLALFRTKSSIGHTVCFFEPDMDENARARRQLAADLRHAVPNGELRLLYQPQRSLMTGRVSGYEALVRWHHPKRGPISPNDFIPLAEETGDIFAIGEWVLREACLEARNWDTPLKVAVNLSPVQFLQQELIERFRAILVETGLSPSRLELEITETAIITDKLRALHCLRQFKAMGVSVAIDDFGTGHSSLDTLHSFPFDKIKIDKSFLQRAETSPQALAIIRTVLSLGRSLSVPVLAEGVENENQLRMLESEGCDEAQGYYFGRPGPAPSLDLPLAANF
ncbi:bifunctional diguanylate cyclase/phosphodiesterase [Novosphingobium beihaiensis]|uniref:EAL domain-containing protein n=1 Tax=Novosphingobium beihaiensis TaxID=2930389 RepID=A0ABT0BVF9_9SPHN|nr:EAL domain-containing protein [Novosphingobium beihaiensis]MCJ2189039.1 EAL domain-containing protein [Novosphingobium beihaiensis]